MDGNYTSTLDIRIPVADLVIFLDYPTHISIYGIIKRGIQYRGDKSRKDMPKDWTETLSYDLLKKVIFFKKLHKPRIEKLLNQNSNRKIIILSNRKKLKLWLANYCKKNCT